MSGYYGPAAGSFIRRFPYVSWGVGVLLSGLVALQAVAMVNAETGSGFLLAQLRTERPENLADRAQRMITRNQPERALALAKRAIRRSPVYQPGVRALGLAMIATGDAENGSNVMAAAGRLGWRDGPTQTWLMQEDFKQQRFKIGFQRAQALVSRVGMTPEIFTLFVLFPNEPELDREFMTQLVSNPEWRLEFFRNARTATPQQVETLATVLQSLSTTKAPPTREEAIEVVNGLINAGEITRAREIDRRFVSKGSGPANTGINDGGFDQLDHYRDAEYRPSPFEWRLGFGRGIASSIEDSGDGNGALFVSADGARQELLATQLLNLPAGSFTLTVDVEGDVTQARDRFNFAIICMTDGESARLETESAEISGKQLRMFFTLPAIGCDSQQLRVEAARATRRSTTAARFDNFAISRR